MDAADSQIRNLNEQIHYAGQLYVNKSIISNVRRKALIEHGSAEKIMAAHNTESMLLREAQSYFSERQLPLPDLQELKAERDRYIKLKAAQQKAYKQFKSYSHDLNTVSTNIDLILSYNRTQDYKRETAQDR